MLSDLLLPYYSKFGDCFCKSLSSVIAGMLHCGSSNTAEIARAMSVLNKKSFNTNDKAISYLYCNDKFQTDDAFWRCYIKMIFDSFREQKFINKGDKIYIQVDFTSDSTDFLIFCASIIYNGRAIPLYFSMRNYPKKKDTYNHKKMELAFLKSLKHLLSKKYQYVIVADRGFGNARFFDYCEENNFEYLIRLQPNMNIKCDKKQGILGKTIVENGKFDVYVKKWERNLDVFVNEKDGSTWYLASNIKELGHECAIDTYKDRFKIEKLFQDLKSSGFDIEKSKIRKYDRFKRILTMSMICHTLMVITGAFIEKHHPALKKNFPIHTRLISAYLHSQNVHLHRFSQKH